MGRNGAGKMGLAGRLLKLPLSWSDSIPIELRQGYDVRVQSADGIILTGSKVVDGEVVLLLPEKLEGATVSLEVNDSAKVDLLPITLPVDLRNDRLLTPVVINDLANVRRGTERIRLVQPYAVNQDDFSPTLATQLQLNQVYTLLQDGDLSVTIHAY
ncbi:MAG: hypothetical protein AAF597_01340, partial [Bacteroidota bacterium]